MAEGSVLICVGFGDDLDSTTGFDAGATGFGFGGCDVCVSLLSSESARVWNPRTTEVCWRDSASSSLKRV